MREAAWSLVSANVLIVEGEDEREFWQAALRGWRRTDIQVLGGGGKTQLRDRLQVLAADDRWADVRWLAVAQDADANPRGAASAVGIARQ